MAVILILTPGTINESLCNMNVLESLRVALRGLSNNKMRTMLTMLGMIIGVGVVIVVVAIGEGATKSVTDAVNSLGTNLLNVTSNRNRLRIGTAVSRTSVVSTAATTNTTPINSLTLQDAEHIAQNFRRTVDAVAPQIDSELQIRLGNVDTTTEVAGTTIDFPYVKKTDIAFGRFFTQQEIDDTLKVCVVGPSVAEHLTGDAHANMTGQTISINRQHFLVLGMLAARGAAATGQDQDDIILVPITTAMRRVLNKQALNNILIRCTTEEMMPFAQDQVSAYLRNRHHLTPPFPDNDDFRIRNQSDLMQTQQSVTGTMTTLLSCVAVISLVVGGIGIMNIMLVSVTERTREIGIRKAIGATPRDILLQFLIESAIISLLGGLIGIAVGVGGALLLASVGGWTTIINSKAILAAVVVSGGVGIFFGIYPASKAAALHPIDALRFE
jgi:putative ABC transport system permease protein